MRQAGAEMPGRYVAELAVIKETGWSWQELLAAPADLIDEMLERLRCTWHWEAERARLDQKKAAQKRRG